MQANSTQHSALRHLRPRHHRKVIGFAFGVILLSAACRAQSPSPPKVGMASGPRTWGEVQSEIEKAFDECYACIKAVIENRRPDTIFGGTSGHSLQPGTSFAEFVFKRHPGGRPEETVVILDVRIERDFSGTSGKASSFRLVRFVARDEGERMFAAMVKYFEKNKLPYDILDRKKDPNEKKFDPANKPSGIF